MKVSEVTCEGSMESTVFYERRRQSTTTTFGERRNWDRRRQESTVVSNQRRSATQIRQQNREEIQIPIQLKTLGENTLGNTLNISAGGLLMVSNLALGSGTLVSMKLSFGDDFCYLAIQGEVVSCRSTENGLVGNYAVGLKFLPCNNWEQKVLRSAIEEVKNNAAMLDRSLLIIDVYELLLPLAKSNGSISGAEKKGKKNKKFTPHPQWVLDMEKRIEPYRKAVWESKLVIGASSGTLSVKQMRTWIIQLYPFIEAFPKYIALNITKAKDQFSTGILIDNVRVEKRHAQQWLSMSECFGIDLKEITSVQPMPKVDALSHWLWSINTQGTLAEAVSANTYAIEGVTSGIARLTVKGFPCYDGIDGIRLDKKAYWWMDAHAAYDDEHPIEALEIIKRYATTRDLQQKVGCAATRSLEYLLLALDACYEYD
jgi:pyrroloquinoline quinone (PQQ) biosynthesis protein C